MSRNIPICTLIAVGTTVSLAMVQPAQAIVARQPVDLVICLDTSGSMTALIDSARAKIWDIVNELAGAKPAPRLRVGLLTYGSPSNSTARDGWIVRQTNLTNDLDTVYARMMGMHTNGGDEFVGWVLHDALHSMSWSSEPNALKIIFVAGNESADQARTSFDFRHVGQRAQGRGIFINAIYAGNRDQGMMEKWHEVALAGRGCFSAIDMEHGTIQIPTPQDDLLYKLNIELNATYIPYGKHGPAGALNQLAQDENSLRMGIHSCASRNAAKGTALYDNGVWDLVDAMRVAGFKLDAIESADLPENMRSMTPDERVAYVDGMRQSRSAIQEKIQQASALRQAFLDQQRRKQSGATGLDDAILKALREQAATKGLEFKVQEQVGPKLDDGC